MKQIQRNNIWILFLCLFLILGSARFIYSTAFKSNVSLFNTSHGIKSIINSVITDFDNMEFHNRRWGPIGVGIVLNGIKTFDPDVIAKKEYSKWPISTRKSYPSFVWRLTQFVTYGISIYFLLNLVSEFQQTRNKEKYYTWSAILVFASLQSSAAIYDINNASGGMFTAFFIIGHFYFFHKKKYFFAAIFIIIGIYFRLHPIVFAFPYFVFACFSKNHRKYVYYLFLVGTFIAIISYPIQGLKYGSFYPLSVIYHISAEPFSSVPVTSQEVINPLSLIYKIINGFEINRNVFIPSKFLSFITISFIILFILSNILAGYILSKYEYIWKNNNQLRLLYLFFFQIVIGYLYLIFSFDVSLEHLLNSLISILAPILLFSITINNLTILKNFKVICYIFFYFFGLTLVGGLLPISIVSIIIPFDLIDKIVGDNTAHIGNYGRFIWYHVPLLGLLIIGIVTYFYSKYLLKFTKSKFPGNI